MYYLPEGAAGRHLPAAPRSSSCTAGTVTVGLVHWAEAGQGPQVARTAARMTTCSNSRGKEQCRRTRSLTPGARGYRPRYRRRGTRCRRLGSTARQHRQIHLPSPRRRGSGLRSSACQPALPGSARIRGALPAGAPAVAPTPPPPPCTATFAPNRHTRRQ